MPQGGSFPHAQTMKELPGRSLARPRTSRYRACAVLCHGRFLTIRLVPC
jgi:hypothetical protein